MYFKKLLPSSFQNLMNKVLHDQPDDPLIYLIKALHKKAGLEVPRDLRPSAVRKGSPERMGNFIHAKSNI